MIALAYTNPPGYGSAGVVNTPEWRGALVPAANAHATAKGLAQVYAALAGSQPPGLVRQLLAEATRVQAAGDCPVLGEYVEYGLGFVPTSARRPMGTNPTDLRSFRQRGAVGFGDPDAGVAFGYVMNHVVPRWQSSRNRALIDSLLPMISAPIAMRAGRSPPPARRRSSGQDVAPKVIGAEQVMRRRCLRGECRFCAFAP